MKYSELKNKMREFNTKHDIERKVCIKKKDDGTLIQMTGKVVLSQEAFSIELPKERRTYTFDNYNKALTSGDIGYSIFAYCEADKDCMRIEDATDDLVEEAEIINVVE